MPTPHSVQQVRTDNYRTAGEGGQAGAGPWCRTNTLWPRADLGAPGPSQAASGGEMTNSAELQVRSITMAV